MQGGIDCLKRQPLSTLKKTLFFNHLGPRQPAYMFCLNRSASCITSHELTQLFCSHGWKQAYLIRLMAPWVVWFTVVVLLVQRGIDCLGRQTLSTLTRNHLQCHLSHAELPLYQNFQPPGFFSMVGYKPYTIQTSMRTLFYNSINCK